MSQYRVFRPNFLSSRFGEMACQLGLFAMLQELQWLEPFKGVVVAPQGGVVNDCLLKYFSPWVVLAEKGDPVDLPSFNAVELRFPDGQLVHEDRACVALFKVWEDQGRQPLLSLTKQHRREGEKILAKMGLPKDAWYVALHVRDKAFLNDDHNDYRNADLESYLQAVKRITDAGGWVIRMGHPEMEKLPKMERVIDYAHCPQRSAEMDVFLLGSARFFLGTTSGPCVVSMLFGVPTAIANYAPFSERPFSSRDIYISKLHLEDGEPIPFDAAMAPPYRHDYELKSPVRDNTAEEIDELTVEMMERLDGSAVYTEEDERLQASLTRLSESFETHGVSSRMGRDFLRRHKHLMPG